MKARWNTTPELIAQQEEDWEYLDLKITKLIEVPLAKLKFHNYDVHGEQEGMPEDHVDQLEAALRAGEPLPPAVAVKKKGVLDVWDGNHRCTAAARLKIETVPVLIAVDTTK